MWRCKDLLQFLRYCKVTLSFYWKYERPWETGSRIDEEQFRQTYSSAIPFSTRFGGVPVKVAIPPTFAANATDKASALASRWISAVLVDRDPMWTIVA